ADHGSAERPGEEPDSEGGQRTQEPSYRRRAGKERIPNHHGEKGEDEEIVELQPVADDHGRDSPQRQRAVGGHHDICSCSRHGTGSVGWILSCQSLREVDVDVSSLSQAADSRPATVAWTNAPWYLRRMSARLAVGLGRLILRPSSVRTMIWAIARSRNHL